MEDRLNERYEDKPGRPFGALPTADHPFVVEVQTNGSTSWARNGLSFETAEDAEAWGRDLLWRWLGASNYRVVDIREVENG